MSARSLVVAAAVLSLVLAAFPAPATSMQRGPKLVTSAVPLFLPFRSFDAGGSPYSVAIGDLNGDGHPDLAVANYTDTTGNHFGTTVSVLLGNGDGTFGAKTEYLAGRGPYSVAIGDLNDDGKLDLVTANLQSNPSTVSVLLGNGDGTFGSKTDYVTGPGPYSVTIGDLNGDGKPDLAVGSGLRNTVSVLLGNGDGTFGANTDYATGGQPASVAIGDLNGDGHPDLAVANFGNGSGSWASTVSVLLGNGDGTFGANTDYASGSGPHSVAIGDLNGDGHPDLAVANYAAYARTVSVLLGNGDGTFGANTDYVTGGDPASVAIGDLNGDGHPDLAVATPGSQVSVLLGNGDGTFGSKTDYGTGPVPFSVAIGDLNGDGKFDLAVATPPNTVSVLLNGTPMFTLTATADPHGSISPTGATIVSYGDGLAYTITPAQGYQVVDVLVDGLSVGAVTSYTFTDVTADHTIAASFAGVLGADDGRPIVWALSPVAPNPLLGAGRVAFDVPRRTQVRLALLDLAGREVDALSHGELGPGRFSVPLDVRSRAPGVYFLRLESAGVRLERAVVVIQ